MRISIQRLAKLVQKGMYVHHSTQDAENHLRSYTDNKNNFPPDTFPVLFYHEENYGFYLIEDFIYSLKNRHLILLLAADILTKKANEREEDLGNLPDYEEINQLSFFYWSEKEKTVTMRQLAKMIRHLVWGREQDTWKEVFQLTDKVCEYDRKDDVTAWCCIAHRKPTFATIKKMMENLIMEFCDEDKKREWLVDRIVFHLKIWDKVYKKRKKTKTDHPWQNETFNRLFDE